MRTQSLLTLLFLIFGFLATSTIIGETPGQLTVEQNPTSDLTVNVNTADAESLAEALDGVGLSRARSIVEWREANGPFQDPYDLVQVRGISERIVKMNEQRIQVSDNSKPKDN